MSTAIPTRRRAGNTRPGSYRRRSNHRHPKRSLASLRIQRKVAAGQDRTDRPERPDLSEILGRLAHAMSIVVVSQRSLAAQELQEAGDEDTTLQEAIVHLRAVYNELDAASMSASLVRQRRRRSAAVKSSVMDTSSS